MKLIPGNGTAFPRRGLALIELMIIIVLISTVATAYWNYHIAQGGKRTDAGNFPAPDSAVAGALNEIGFYVNMAQPDTIGGRTPLVIECKGGSDRIIIKQKGASFEFFVDPRGKLIRRADSKYETIAEDVLSLKATRLGAETVILTIAIEGPNSLDLSERNSRSYSKVITSDAIFASSARAEGH